MRELQKFTDGSIDYGQAGIGPSLDDISRSRNPSKPITPLRHTRGRDSSIAGVSTASAIVVLSSAPGDTIFQGPNGEYCTIKFPPDQGFTNEDYLRFAVDFNEPSNPNSEHRVVIKNEFGQIVNSDRSRYRTDDLEDGIELIRYSYGDYSLEVREKAVDLIFGDEGKSCEVDLRISENGGMLDENGNVISPERPDGQDLSIARTESMQEIYDAFFLEFNGQRFEANPESLNNPDLKDTWYQCMDLLYAWADALGVPREVVRHQYAKEVFTLANDETRKYFDVIPYEKGLKPELGDIVVFNEKIGNFAGHVAIATGKEKKVFKGSASNLSYVFETFGQNYPIGSPSAIKEFEMDDKVIGILRAKGFARPEETQNPADRQKEAKKRIEEVLRVENGDSIEMLSKKTVLSRWFEALNSRQVGEYGVFLERSILNLDEWAGNFERLLRGEAIQNDPLKIAYLSRDRDGRITVGKGEIDDISIFLEDPNRIGLAISRVYIQNRERSQARLYYYEISELEARKKLDDLPPMSRWRNIGYQAEIREKDGMPSFDTFTNYSEYIYIGDNRYDTLDWIINYGGWKGIDLISPPMFLNMDDLGFDNGICITEDWYESSPESYRGCIAMTIKISVG